MSRRDTARRRQAEHDRLADAHTPKAVERQPQEARKAMTAAEPHADGKCGARTRAGGFCAQPRVPGRPRCRYHGGRAPVGVEHYRYVDGRRSKYLPRDLRKRYADAVQDAQSRTVEDEIHVLDARITQQLARLNEPGVDADAVWRSVFRAIERKRRLVDSEIRRQVKLQRVITLEQMHGLLEMIRVSIVQNVKDPAAIAAVKRDLERALTVH